VLFVGGFGVECRELGGSGDCEDENDFPGLHPTEAGALVDWIATQYACGDMGYF